jgi:lipoprotein-anchoring transpeptidase ErfK/SrfK
MASQQKVSKRIVIVLDQQRLYAYEGNDLIHNLNCVTGDNEHLTPVGKYNVYLKHEKHFSQQYKVNMDNAMFFHKGYAIHQAYFVDEVRQFKVSGSNGFGSHGCVRLSVDNAIKLFDWTPIGTPVEVKNISTP